MPRRRRNRSGGGVQKKVQKVGRVDVCKEVSRHSKVNESQTQTRGRTRGQCSAFFNSPNDTTPEDRPSEDTGSSFAVKATSIFLENSCDVETLPEPKAVVDPLELVTTTCTESALDSKDDVKLSVSSPASFVDVKLEVDDENEVSLCNEDKGSDDTIDPIRMEVMDCGVRNWGPGLKNTIHDRVPQLLSHALDPSVVSEVQRSLNAVLPQDWFCKAAEDGFNVMLLSRCKEKAIQRRLFFPFVGGMEVSVHRKLVQPQDVEELLEGQLPSVPVTVDSYQTFVEHVMKIVEKFWCMEVCGGADQCEFVDLWNDEVGRIDENPYGEIRYKRTFRSLLCKLLVQSQKWRCRECSRLSSTLKRWSNKKKGGHHIIKNLPDRKETVYVLKQEMSVTKEDGSETIYILRNDNKLSLSTGPDGPCVFKERPTSKLPLPTTAQPQVLKESRAQILSENSPVACSTSDSSSPVDVKHSVMYEKIAPKTYCSSASNLLLSQNCVEDDVIYTASGKIIAELEKCGVPLEDDLSTDLMSILKDSVLTPVQKQLIEKQSELAANKKAFGMRWHPTLIRFALFVRSTYSERFTSTGMITLPSGKNLFNFSQVLFKITEFQKADLNEILQKLYLKTCNLLKAYHILLLDEIDVYNNLVFQKSNGELIGYVKLSDVKSEMDQLEAYISVGKAITFNPKPYSLLVYMVKGLPCGMKELVGLIDACTVSKETLYDMTWNLIGNLEEKGIRVIAVVSNGSPKAKEFFDCHVPSVKLESGHVFSTANLKARDRLIYFFLDASYLLKEIRNCFEESGAATPKQKTLTRDDKPIVWETITKLYSAGRKQSSLNAQNVFLNEYSRKRPSHASAVMSAAVAKDLYTRGWSFTSETVNFLTQVHDFFSASFLQMCQRVGHPKIKFCHIPVSVIQDFQKCLHFSDICVFGN